MIKQIFYLLLLLLNPFLNLSKLAKSIKGIFKVGRRSKIRGVTFEDFLASCKSPTDELANKAWDLFCKEDWKGLEKLFNDNKLNGGWPPRRVYKYF